MKLWDVAISELKNGCPCRKLWKSLSTQKTKADIVTNCKTTNHTRQTGQHHLSPSNTGPSFAKEASSLAKKTPFSVRRKKFLIPFLLEKL